jgi:hypothetical protein
MAKQKITKSKKTKKKLFRIINPVPFLIATGLIGIVIALAAITYFNPSKTDTASCRTNDDCGWKITNCCPETAGALWECVNLREFKKPDCPRTVLCPQVISPKPSPECACEGGKCAIK